MQTNIVAITMPGIEKMTLMPMPASALPMPVVPAVDEDQREADDTGDDRERQVDQRVEDALAGEVVPHQQDRGESRRRSCWRGRRRSATTDGDLERVQRGGGA